MCYHSLLQIQSLMNSFFNYFQYPLMINYDYKDIFMEVHQSTELHADSGV